MNQYFLHVSHFFPYWSHGPILFSMSYVFKKHIFYLIISVVCSIPIDFSASNAF